LQFWYLHYFITKIQFCQYPFLKYFYCIFVILTHKSIFSPNWVKIIASIPARSPMFKIYTPAEANHTILKRLPFDEEVTPPAVMDSIERIFEERLSPESAVRWILKDVRNEGDRALMLWTEKIDHVQLKTLRVPPQTLAEAVGRLSPEMHDILMQAIGRVEAFHRRQPLTSWLTNELGGTLGQVVRPIQRVGLYVPGGTAPLPSSVIMSAIPARVAGVPEIVVVSPPAAGGAIADVTLAACALAGIQEVYTLGGAQAIAALAYGTESIPRVDKIFGPGNLFVTLAKRQVFGYVGIDGLYGPTETMVIADEKARPEWVAADLLAQAEHDVLASAILLTPSRSLAERVQAIVEQNSTRLPRRAILSTSLTRSSGIVLTRDVEQAVNLANAYGPEHLCLAVEQPWSLVEGIRNAGGVFLGETSYEVLGDYIAGPSHAMPTGGSARFSSPLNVWDFVHLLSLVALDPITASKISATAAAFARAEGLEAHAQAADFRAAGLSNDA
jgi:histidinol dehydrogenase